MIDITVQVPADRVDEFHAMFHRWLVEAEVPGGWPADGTSGEPVEWSESDDELARAYWGKLSEFAKALFSALMERPGEKFTGDELGLLLGLPDGKHTVAKILGWPGRFCRELGRKWPWAWEYPDGQSASYWMTDEVAALFRRAERASSS